MIIVSYISILINSQLYLFSIIIEGNCSNVLYVHTHTHTRTHTHAHTHTHTHRYFICHTNEIKKTILK